MTIFLLVLVLMILILIIFGLMNLEKLIQEIIMKLHKDQE